MGAKQSKRSVDISGKEAEGGGDVATAGGAGRLEPLADADSLKPHLNGDAHIQTPDDVGEKKLENGTPETDKDATTEKEKDNATETAKEAQESPVTNGESEHKEGENGESTPAATPEQESGKKPKKEKVKKKWSLRSISFSRKDKPKQEKKVKEEENKTNGEPEKVPEEVVEQPAEATEVKAVESSGADSDQKTPDTPVTEPLTNGDSAPETPKVETPIAEEPAVVDKVAEVEQLPLNGLSIQEEKAEDVKVEASPETAPAPETPKSEVCVETAPLTESVPPPLPANPPPSSVASFAATTMATPLADVANTTPAETAPPSTDINTDIIPLTKQNEPELSIEHNETAKVEIPAPTKEVAMIAEEVITVPTQIEPVVIAEKIVKEEIVAPVDKEIEMPAKIEEIAVPAKIEEIAVPAKIEEIEVPVKIEEIEVPVKIEEIDVPAKMEEVEVPIKIEEIEVPAKIKEIEIPAPVQPTEEPIELPKPVECEIDETSSADDIDILDLPPPEPMIETESSSPVTENVTSENGGKSDDEIIDNGPMDNGLCEEDLEKDFQGNELDETTVVTQKTKLVMTNGECNGNADDFPPPPQDLIAEKILEVVAPEVTIDAPPSSETVTEATSEAAQ